MASSVHWIRASSDAELHAAVLLDVSTTISAAITARGEALVAFPGGKTPMPILEALASSALEWEKVTVIPSDDRLVPMTSPLSNVAVLTRLFAPRGARVLALGDSAAHHADDAADDDADEYARMGRRADALLQRLVWPPDVVWLGMGGDGHTASVFAGPDLERALSPSDSERAVGVRPDPMPPEAPVNRVTLTAPAIAAARRVIIVITGSEKRQLLERAIAEGALSSFPVGRVLAMVPTPISVYCLG